MSVGTVLALLLILAMGVAYSGGLWLLTAHESPLQRRWRRGDIDRTVRREVADLDRKIVELMRGMQQFD